MNIKRIASIAIIAALPFTATAENISGDMYVAPEYYSNDRPAPTTNNAAPYGRINIDIDDQSHIATTAYVKGAYNSAIAGVNRIAEDLRNRLINMDTRDSIDSDVYSSRQFDDMMQEIGDNGSSTIDVFGDSDVELVTAKGVAAGIQTYVSGRGVEIYTTWDDNDTTTVGFVPLHY